ncbi:O-antigen ligase family protein [Saccharicrinis aurantiacus]|uniref:O-antigen ligase family protein n=1 Tax=Saccharicrinis aurantiacus TaxID=1849719 RepID=UPI00094F54F3|nr:O-antigen ligase family protein [Saccharicrinis aurantiacus]
MRIGLPVIREINVFVLMFFILYLASPFVDSLTGFLIKFKYIAEGSPGSPSQLYRLLMIGFALAILVYKKELSPRIVYLIFFFLSLELFNSLFHHYTKGLFIGIIYDFKIVYVFLLIKIVKVINKNTDIDKNLILKLFFLSVIIHAILIILPKILGVGLSTYEDGTFGTKGFFPSNNGLGICMGVGALYIIDYVHYYNIKFKNVIIAITLISALLIGSKTVILLTLVSGLFFLSKKSKIYSILVLLLVVCLIVVFYNEIVLLFSTMFEVIIFRYNNNSFFDFIASSRFLFVSEAFRDWDISGINVYKFFVGGGSFLSFRPLPCPQVFDTIETDLFDVFFFYGLIGVFIYIYFFSYVLYIGIRNNARKVFVLGWCFLFAHSVLAGHIIFNGMSLLVLLSFFYGMIYTSNNTYTSINSKI